MSGKTAKAIRLRIYLNEQDKADGQPLYEALVKTAHGLGLMGATVFRGVESYGHRGSMHAAKVLRLSDDLPLVVEVIDRPEALEPFMEPLGRLMSQAGGGGLVTREPVELLTW